MKHLSAIVLSLLLSGFASAQLSCTVTSCGESCGPNLTVTYTPHAGGNYRINLTSTGLHPHALMGQYWGDAPVTVQLPNGPGCLLLINPIWGTFHTTDSTGSFSWERTWPHWATARFYMQTGSLMFHPNGTWSSLSTNCKIGRCF